MTTDGGVAPDALLLGALYALEQCGLLLTDAVVLLEQRRYPTAAGIALLAHEELGRHQVLLDLWRRSLGTLVPRMAVIKACKDHVEKQRRGQASLTYRGGSGDQIDQLVKARRDSPPGSSEQQAALKKLRLLDEHRRRQQPTDRHKMRMSAFYVDLDGDTWSRPRNLDPQECAAEVENASNDYNHARLRIEEAATVHGDSQLAEAVAALERRPTVPQIPPPPLML